MLNYSDLVAQISLQALTQLNTDLLQNTLEGYNAHGDLSIETVNKFRSRHGMIQEAREYVAKELKTRQFIEATLINGISVATMFSGMGSVVNAGKGIVGRLLFGAGGKTRVFWSGGNIAKEAAFNFAKANGMKTLEMTFRGRIMNTINPLLPRPISNSIWKRLSTNFAQGAKSEAHFFTTIMGPRATSIWLNVEMPILLQNGVNIIKHITKGAL